jgi:hypothetical protein
MKPRFNLFCIFFIAFIFAACDSEDVNSDFENYWSSNALVRSQLRGKVKAVANVISENEQYIVEFNEKGNISKQTATYSTSTETSDFTYGANGELTKIVFVSTGEYPSTSTTTYTYDTHGRYIVQYPFHLHETGLIPNLKSIVNNYGKTDYEFVDDNLLIISTIQNMIDTSIVKYNGKYPSSYTGEYSFMSDISFAQNGMFTSYSEGFYGEGYRDTRVYTFQQDDQYLLLKSMKNTSTYSSGSSESTMEISYNEQKDILLEVQDDYETEYSDYVYDKQNNWTSRKVKTRQGSTSNWSEVQVETRQITYWD